MVKWTYEKNNQGSSHLSQSDRDEIYILKEKGYSLRAIAQAIGRVVSTISDEIRINSTDGVYDPKKANHKAYVRRKYSKYQGMKIVGNAELQAFVEEKLYDHQKTYLAELKNTKSNSPLSPKTAFIDMSKASTAGGLNIIGANENAGGARAAGQNWLDSKTENSLIKGPPS